MDNRVCIDGEQKLASFPGHPRVLFLFKRRKKKEVWKTRKAWKYHVNDYDVGLT